MGQSRNTNLKGEIVKDVTNERIYNFTENEKLKIDNLRLQIELHQTRLQNVQQALTVLFESFVTQKNLGTKDTVTLLPDYSGFSIKDSGENNDCQETDTKETCTK
jgi:hypothetical protein